MGTELGGRVGPGQEPDQVLILTGALVLLLASCSARAQIVADPHAPSQQRPRVGQAANGIPQVDIQTPNAAGLSRNTYRQFDVGLPGAILNNSRHPVQTQLGGFVHGNPWLAGGTARAILNEVNSSDPSQLRGYVEVAGARADVIIANPSGIVVDGAGFINARGVTLTTGSVSPVAPQLRGAAPPASPHIDLGQGLSYQVHDGLIVLGGRGLDDRNSESTSLIARGVEIHSALWSQTLRIVAGISALPAGERRPKPPPPRFAIDITPSGALYAGRILLVGAEPGGDMSNTGGIFAGHGTLSLRADGWLGNSGVMEANGGLAIHTTGLSNTEVGRIYGHNVRIATEILRNTGVIAARGSAADGGGIDIQARAVHNRDGGLIYSAADLRVGAQAIVNHSATLEAQGALALRTGSLDNHYDNLGYRVVLDSERPGSGVCGEDCSTHYTERRYRLEAVPGAHGPGRIVSGGDMHIAASGAVVNASSQILAGGVLDIQGARIDNRGIDVPLSIVQRGFARQRKTKRIWSEGFKEVEFWVHSPYAREFPDQQTLQRGQSQALQSLAPRAAPVPMQTGLFEANLAPDAPYLIATDARFTQRQTWLGSDYMQRQLAIDPSAMQKRLGDNFYESRLINAQVAQLTGRRFLGDYRSEMQQNQALMDAGIAFARNDGSSGLPPRPGVRLSARHLALLRHDIIWLEQTSVTLRDGSRHRVLIPRVYLAPQNMELSARGRLVQRSVGQASMAGTAVALQAHRIVNRGGAMAADQVALRSTQDIDNAGGQIRAQQQLRINAGRDFIAQSRSRQTVHDAGAVRTVTQAISHTAALDVANAGGTLHIQAGRDVQLHAAQVQSAGTLGIRAGRDVALRTVATRSDFDATLDIENFNRQSFGTEVGSHLQAATGLRLHAGRDLQARGAIVQSRGELALHAAQDMVIESGQSYAHDATGRTVLGRGLLASSKATGRRSRQQTHAVSSQLEGEQVNAHSGANTTISASQLLARQDLRLVADGNLQLLAGQITGREGRYSGHAESGLTLHSGSLHLGQTAQSAGQQSSWQHVVAATVGSQQGALALRAGNRYRQVGSRVLAPQGDITLDAAHVQIEEARLHRRSTQTRHFMQSGLHVSLHGGLLQGAQTLQSLDKAAQNTHNRRMQVLAAASGALAVRQALAHPLPSLSAGMGSTQSDSRQVQQADTAHASLVQAGGTVILSARQRDVVMQGSRIRAGDTVQITAARDAVLRAASNSASEMQHHSSGSRSLGSGFDGTMGVTVGASSTDGNADGTDRSHTHSEVNGRVVRVRSGADTSVFGAVISGQRVALAVGADLHIESPQDHSKWRERTRAIGGSLTLGPAPAASLQRGNTTMDSQYRSVTRDSGIQAGDGGFQVDVGANTTLVGGVIASTDAANRSGHNHFYTGGVGSLRDLRNHAAYSARGAQAGLSVGGADGLSGMAGSGGDGRIAHSTSHAGISGLHAVRTGDRSNGIETIFDADAVRNAINAQVHITQVFGTQATAAIRHHGQEQRARFKAGRKAATSDAQRSAVDRAEKALIQQEKSLHVLVSAVSGMAGLAITKETLSRAANAMRTVMLQDSRRFVGVTDGHAVLNNHSGPSEGMDGDHAKLGGTRLDLDILCGKTNAHCVIQRGSNGDAIRDANGIPVLALDRAGNVTYVREELHGKPLPIADFIQRPAGQKMVGHAGGVQGAPGTLFGVPYAPGSWQDQWIEAFAGPHDFIGGRVSGLYDAQGNARRGRSPWTTHFHDRWSDLAIIPSAPFAAAHALPLDVWNAIAILLKGAP